MAAVELLEVSRTIRSAMGESAGQFKQAASSSNANLSKIVKDIATTFASQRKDITELHNTISEGQYSAEQTNEKIDGLTRVFQESLSIQSNMLGEMRSISKNIKILNDNTESMNRNLNNSLIGTGSSSILSSLNTGFGDVSGAIAGLVIGGAAAYGLTQMTGGGGGGPTGQGVGETGSSSEAMSFFQSKGWSKEQAAGIVGNLQTESGKTLKTNAVGDKRQAYGIAQWHPYRQAKFQQVMGIPIRQSNFKQQLEFVQWELMNSEKRAGEMLKAAGTAIEAARAVDYGYERSTHKHLGQRMANAVALAKEGGAAGAAAASTITPTSVSSNTTDATNQKVSPTVVAPDTSPRVDPIGKEGGHGPISSTRHAEKIETSAALPSGDLVALGNALKGMKVQVSEHPAFGGVSPTAHGKNSAHYDGNAIDINAPGGITEAQDPVWGSRFDQLAKQIQAAGYTVLWRTRGHEDHIHAQIGGKGIRGGHSVIGGQITPSAGATPTTPGSSAPEMSAKTPDVAAASTPSAVPIPSSAEPMSQAPITQSMMAPQMAGPPIGQMMGMLGGMLPMGLSGILGSVLPMIGSALQQLESTPMNFAELTPQPTPSTQNIQRVKEAALESQTTQETYQTQMMQQPNTPAISSQNPSLSQGDSSGYAYNQFGDIGWPDWAAMIGGNHWEEMKHYKKNMWG